MKTSDMEKYNGKKSFLCMILYGSQFTGYGCYSQQSNVSRKDLKQKACRLLCSRKFILFSFYRAQLCINSALNVLIHSSI